MRVDWKPGTLIYPLPAVLISCGTMEDGGANILTASWVSTVCTNPPMCVVESALRLAYRIEVQQSL